MYDSILNETQLEAVTNTEGVIRVIAGAGSGKTRALTHRFAFLVNEIGILPGNILCVTFTNKAANEMRQRIHNLTGDNDTGYINTFHGFCVSVLQEDSHAVQYPKSFVVLDNSDIDSVLRIIYEERGLTLRDMTFSAARDMIEIQKLFRKPEYYLDMIDMSLDNLKEKYDQASDTDDIIFYGYLYQEKKNFGLDYNDLIKFCLYIFRQNSEICLKWQKRLEYIMIDEFQDIDALQYELMKVLCTYHRNLFVVGDPDQTIYTWRGANIRYLLDLEKEYSDVKTVMMLQNYRSVPPILNAANSLISANKTRIKKDLVPILEGGTKPVFHFAMNQEAEAAWIAKEIKKNHENGMPYKDITVLYRSHFVSRSVEDALLKENIPYHIYSGTAFFERTEIKDALSYLRMIVLRDDLSFRRIVNKPKRNMGKRRMEFLEKYEEEHDTSLYNSLVLNLDNEIFKGTRAASFISLVESFSSEIEDIPVSDLLAKILNTSGYEEMLRTEGSQERLDNLAELKQSVYEYEISCGEEAGAVHYLSHAALFANADTQDSSDSVKLMTVHAAKGLEFPYVFLCGMNEGVFPSGKIRDLDSMEEERRLAFVAFTRAQKGLYLSGAAGRNFDGTPRYPSRFVIDAGEENLEYSGQLSETLITSAKDYILHKDSVMPQNIKEHMLSEGTRIRHEYLGEGTLLRTDMDKAAYLIKFDNIETPRNISVRVKLEVIE